MTKERFDTLLMCCKDEEDILDFARKFIIHGVPHVFEGREDEFFEFRNRISKQFLIDYYQVYIVDILRSPQNHLFEQLHTHHMYHFYSPQLLFHKVHEIC